MRFRELIACLISLSIVVHCASTSATNAGEKTCQVVATGSSLEDAKRTARQSILEECLGAVVESQSISKNAQSVKNVITSAS